MVDGKLGYLAVAARDSAMTHVIRQTFLTQSHRAAPTLVPPQVAIAAHDSANLPSPVTTPR